VNPSTGELLRSGLAITVLGMGLVFAALALLWGVLRLLSIVFQDKVEPAPQVRAAPDEAALTEERARVAALVAGALLANALPLLFEAPTGPAFEHGRTAPSWVTGNRALALHSWQPIRIPEPNPHHDAE
jgi:Na+-transporting methylmalonyl-CoA/oxaloacetate decarboxylase gamma subunit